MVLLKKSFWKLGGFVGGASQKMICCFSDRKMLVCPHKYSITFLHPSTRQYSKNKDKKQKAKKAMPDKEMTQR